jgi:hypothetical protein
MTDLGEIKKYLGVEFNQVPEGLLLHQRDYLLSILQDFGMTNCRPAALPINPGTTLTDHTGTLDVSPQLYRKLVGKLIYATNT